MSFSNILLHQKLYKSISTLENDFSMYNFIMLPNCIFWTIKLSLFGVVWNLMPLGHLWFHTRVWTIMENRLWKDWREHLMWRTM